MINRKHLTLEEPLNAAMRALAGNVALSLQLQGTHSPSPLSAQGTVFVPPPEDDTLDITRAHTDQLGLAGRYHDAALHQQHHPADAQDQAIFDALECARLDACGASIMQGLAKNIAALRTQQATEANYSYHTDATDPPLAAMLSALLLHESAAFPIPETLAPWLEQWMPYLQKYATPHLEALQDALHEQEAFAKEVSALLNHLRYGGQAPPQEELTPDDNEPNSDAVREDAASDGADQGDAPDASMEMLPSQDTGGQDKVMSAIAPLDDTSDGMLTGDMPRGASEGEQQELHVTQVAAPAYTSFTNAHDEIITADKLTTPDELIRLRGELDEKLAQVRGTFAKLSAELQRYLLARQQRRWVFDLEEGLLDSARLARLITNPTQRTIFKQEDDTDFRDTVVTLLLDNSGSMRGRPITITALCSDILAKILERAGIKVEILGFTTKEWKGGQSYKDWVAADKPAHPGRLNDLRHIVYKSADTPFIRARRNLGLMLKDGILKENIDGEALQWAHTRLRARPEARRILMVISDGAPVDDASLSSNHPAYLDKHLRHVIEHVESDPAIELVAIGIGHDVTRYYERSICLNDVNKLGETMTKELVTLFEGETKK